jgi:hypothetical protein
MLLEEIRTSLLSSSYGLVTELVSENSVKSLSSSLSASSVTSTSTFLAETGSGSGIDRWASMQRIQVLSFNLVAYKGDKEVDTYCIVRIATVSFRKLLKRHALLAVLTVKLMDLGAGTRHALCFVLLAFLDRRPNFAELRAGECCLRLVLLAECASKSASSQRCRRSGSIGAYLGGSGTLLRRLEEG